MESVNQFSQLFMEKVRQFDKLLGWQFKNETACCGVTLSQYQIILELGKVGQTSMVDLATILGIDNSTLSRNINGMVILGLVSRELNAEDRRYVTLSLTAPGLEVYRTMEQQCNQFFREVLKLIPAEKQLQLLDSFNILVSAIVTVREEGKLPQCCVASSTTGKEV